MNSVQRILVVEDEPLIAMMLEDFLDVLGKQAAATADSVATALAAIDSTPVDAAILDVNLRGGKRAPQSQTRWRRRTFPSSSRRVAAATASTNASVIAHASRSPSRWTASNRPWRNSDATVTAF